MRKARYGRGDSREVAIKTLYESDIVTKNGKLKKEYKTPIYKTDIKQMEKVLNSIRERKNHFICYYNIIPHTLYIGEYEYNTLYYCNSIISEHGDTAAIDDETREYIKIMGLDVIRVKKDKYCKVGI